MKIYSTPALVAVLLTLGASSCKKDTPEAALPPATHEGKNTGGCLINGERFVAAGWPSGSILNSNPTPPLSGGFSFDSVYRVLLNGQYRGQNATIMLFTAQRPPRHVRTQQKYPILSSRQLPQRIASRNPSCVKCRRGNLWYFCPTYGTSNINTCRFTYWHRRWHV